MRILTCFLLLALMPAAVAAQSEERATLFPGGEGETPHPETPGTAQLIVAGVMNGRFDGVVRHVHRYEFAPGVPTSALVIEFGRGGQGAQLVLALMRPGLPDEATYPIADVWSAVAEGHSGLHPSADVMLSRMNLTIGGRDVVLVSRSGFVRVQDLREGGLHGVAQLTLAAADGRPDAAPQGRFFAHLTFHLPSTEDAR